MDNSLRFQRAPNIAPSRRDVFARARAILGVIGVTALAACGGDGGGVLGPGTGGTTVAGGPTSSPSASPNPFAGEKLYVNPNSNARKTADEWRATRPADADQMEKIAARSQARWFNEWVGDIYTAVTGAMSAAESQGAMPVLVAYNIPDRDCGGLSGGGGATAEGYRTWINSFANAIAGRKAAVILEPDALANMGCLSAAGQASRVDLIRYAIQALKGKGARVYLDGGHPAWHSAQEMARRLTLADIGSADDSRSTCPTSSRLRSIPPTASRSPRSSAGSTSSSTRAATASARLLIISGAIRRGAR